MQLQLVSACIIFTLWHTNILTSLSSLCLPFITKFSDGPEIVKLQDWGKSCWRLAHRFIGKNAIDAIVVQLNEPVEPFKLILPHLSMFDATRLLTNCVVHSCLILKQICIFLLFCVLSPMPTTFLLVSPTTQIDESRPVLLWEKHFELGVLQSCHLMILVLWVLPGHGCNECVQCGLYVKTYCQITAFRKQQSKSVLVICWRLTARQ